ncbi:BTAD domain-containing putative transcriptional regulator [Terrabacter sp. Soil810]|uniref:AfsR/SARP family transcriptional regulator n=1 Tax=Terrabacter sp. Soil810 TaxID=1736418 RepID=UPI00138F6731|nr:BTAD domain-containing putative transcriptional regulator [Terrabacter sp. Soil810]
MKLLRGFEMRLDGRLVALPAPAERMVALLAIRARPQHRRNLAATLWMDSTESRAAASLRTALWRTRQTVGDCVEVRGAMLALAPHVSVDLNDLMNHSRRLLGDNTCISVEDVDPADLDGDLLPDWDEDWILFERERMRQLRIHALEAMCHKLSLVGRPGPAIDAGLAAVAAEPLRETAQRILIAAYLREGNVCEARRQYHVYSELLRDALGIEPSESLRALLKSAGTGHDGPASPAR